MNDGAHPAWQRALRRDIRQAGGPGKPLWPRWDQARQLLGHGVLFLVALLIGLGMVTSSQESVRTFLLILGMHACLVLHRIAWRHTLEWHPNRFLYAFWPTPPRQAFRDLMGRAALGTIPISSALAAVLAIGGFLDHGNIARAAGQALIIAMLCPLLGWTYRWLHESPMKRWLEVFDWGFLLTGIGLLILLKSTDAESAFHRPVMSFIEGHGISLGMIVPGGWLALTWLAWTQDLPYQAPQWVAGLFLAAPVLGIPFLWRWEWNRFDLHGPGFVEWVESNPTLDIEHPPWMREPTWDDETPPHPSGIPDPPSAPLEDRHWIPGLARTARWWQRWIWRWWSADQRLAAEAMNPAWPSRMLPNWKAGCVGIALLALFGIIHGWDFSTSRAHSGTFLFGIAGIALILLGFVPFGSAWDAVQIYRKVPVSPADIAVLRWKSTAVCTLGAVPILMIVGTVFLQWAREPAWMGTLIGAQVALSPMALSPMGTMYGWLNESPSRKPSFFLFKVGLGLLALLNILLFLLLVLPGLGVVGLALCAAMNALGLWMCHGMLDRVDPQV